ncbi:hypothetical protein [Streptomyces sp. WAC 06725]|uniref:hypothetical protein n=1 Tax=Streptomyces sp. WAC 06725 TaxID=2203209 RepID=UPI0037DA718D
MGQLAPLADVLRRAAAELAASGARTATSGAAEASDTAVRIARVARNALRPQGSCWRAGSRVQLPLRPRLGSDDAARAGEAAKKVAAALLDHPDVLLAHWDGGLSRLVVRAPEEALLDAVRRRAEELAARHGLEPADEGGAVCPPHPGDAGDVRAAATALACDAAGAVAALTGRAMRWPRSPRLVTAAAALLREDPRVRGALRRRFGGAGADLALAAVNAAAHGLGQSPTALMLDGILRAGQLAEALARAVAFDAAHDKVCVPDRASLSGAGLSRPPLRPPPGAQYADAAVTGSLVGAAATLVFTRDPAGAAEAVLAGSPKAARYGPAAFTAAVGTALAQGEVLIRSVERLRRLELVDTVVLHPGALRGRRRTVLDVFPVTSAWDHDRLWHAAAAALRRADDAAELASWPVAGRTSSSDGVDRPAVSLRSPSGGVAGTGRLIASAGGRDIGAVLVTWELDPLAEAVLDAARRAGLHVVTVADPSLGDFAALADTVVAPERPLAEVVRELQEDGRMVATVTRIGPEDTGDREVLAGLLAGDLAVSVTDGRSAVAWGADVLALNGLEGVWRLLAAAPAARAVGRRATVLAQSGAALSGLLVVTGGSPARRAFLSPGIRLGPVNAAAAAALCSGWRAAYGALGRRPPPARDRACRGTP